MRRLRALLAGLLSVWLPIDAAVAGWWHHHHHALPVAYGPLPGAPCGGPPAPWAGWEHAVIIDDRPLFAPAPVVFVATPVVEVIQPIESVVWQPVSFETVSYESAPVESVVVGGVVDESVDTLDGCACSACGEGAIENVIDGVPVDEGLQHDTTEVIGTDDTIDFGTPSKSNITEADSAPRFEPTPEKPIAKPLEAPKTPTITHEPPPSTTPPTVTAKPADGAAASVLEPRETVTLQGQAAAPVEAPTEESEGFEAPADDATDEPMEDGDAAQEPWEDDAVVKEPAAPAKGGARNLFDEVPADEAPAADDFGAPADDDGAMPDAPPMEEGFEPPADEAPLDDMPADDMPMEEAPAGDDGFEAPADEAADAPMDDVGDDAQTEETPAPEEPAADPFDSSRLRVPAEPTRLWQDDTGRFSTEGRLVEIRSGSVRILKVTGRHTTVPVGRLSAADRAHVAGVRRALVATRPASGDTAGIR